MILEICIKHVLQPEKSMMAENIQFAPFGALFRCLYCVRVPHSHVWTKHISSRERDTTVKENSPFPIWGFHDPTEMIHVVFSVFLWNPRKESEADTIMLLYP